MQSKSWKDINPLTCSDSDFETALTGYFNQLESITNLSESRRSKTVRKLISLLNSGFDLDSNHEIPPSDWSNKLYEINKFIRMHNENAAVPKQKESDKPFWITFVTPKSFRVRVGIFCFNVTTHKRKAFKNLRPLNFCFGVRQRTFEEMELSEIKLLDVKKIEWYAWLPY